jgi:phosphorylase kinase alpha/beta subunit
LFSVQVVVLAKNKHIQDLLHANNISVKSLKDVTSIEVHPARVLSHLYAVLGKSRLVKEKLKL